MSEASMVLAAITLGALLAIPLLANTLLPGAPDAARSRHPSDRLSLQLKKYVSEMTYRFRHPESNNEEVLYAALMQAFGGDYTSQPEIQQFRTGEMLRMVETIDTAYNQLDSPAPGWQPTKPPALIIPTTAPPKAQEFMF